MLPVTPLVAAEPEEPGTIPFFPAYLWPIVGGALAIAVIAIVVLGNRPSSMSSVVVCPFENMSTKPDEPFVYGFREQLVSTLYRVPNLRVVKAPCEVPVHQIPGELGVASVVTGSVQQAGGRVRITAQVVAGDGVILWSESIDGAAEEVEEVFGLHERVANRVRDAILGESKIAVTASTRPASFEAYDLYLLGDFAFSKRSEPELNRAVELFTEAINLDPNYGPAYLGLANSYVLLADYPDIDTESNYEEAIKTANRGAELDPRIRDAVGTVYGFVDTKRFKWAEAAEAFETAINSSTVNPTSYQSSSHHWYSRFLANIGLLEKSLEHAKMAYEMDTASPILNARLGVAYHWLNDAENARKYYAKAADKEVGSWIHNLAYTLFLMRERRIDEARHKAKEALESYGQPTDWVDPVFDGFLNPSDTQSLDKTITSVSVARASGALPTNIELVLWAEYWEVEIIYLDEFKVLREHEEFPELLQALGLTDYWSEIGCRWNNDRVLCDAA
jgi:TolB-like protein/Tfp pilus assembly protein PilF